MHHRARPPHAPRYPAHVVLRRAKGLPSMRAARIAELLRHSAEAVSGDDFRVLFVGANTDRVNLVVEADSNEAMTRGMSSFTIRVARSFNKLTGRSGQVWDDRYRDRPLKTVEELREALESFTASPDEAAIIAKPKTAIAKRL
jgi:hypothetical protein